MKLITPLAISLLAIGLATTAHAQTPARANPAGRAWLGRAGTRGAATAPGARLDQRAANQQRRINAGIKQGQLTPAEVAQLQALETNIQTLETTFKSEGPLTKPEVQQLRSALNDASLQIWAQRHDTEGTQMPVLRLGKEVFAQDQLTTQIESGTLTHPQAREFLQGFHQMATLKRRLATESLTPAQRAALQTEYNTLLNKYFVMK
jgi:hypothetical protein